MTALPWHHPDSKAAAVALGLAPAQVAKLRRQGAPWPATGPIDELALRLWNRDSDKPVPLPPPTGALAPYADFLLPPERTATTEPDAADALKAARAEHEALKIAARKQTLIKQGQAAASAVVNDAERSLLHTVQAIAADLWAIAHDRPRHQAEPAIIRKLKTTVSETFRASLRKVR